MSEEQKPALSGVEGAIELLEKVRRKLDRGVRSRKITECIDQALAALQAQLCATCKGTGERKVTLFPFDNSAHYKVVSCTDCQPVRAGDFTAKFRSQLDKYVWPDGKTIASPAIKDIFNSGREACDRIDQLEAIYEAQGKRIEELEAERNEAYQKGKKDMGDSANKHIKECEDYANSKARDCKQLQADLAAAKKEIEELRQALKKYGRHKHCSSCAVLVEKKKGKWYPKDCDCGFDQALQAKGGSDEQDS